MQPEPQVVTGEAVAVELSLAGAGSRAVAALIDLAAIGFLLVVLIIIVAIAGAGANSDTFTTISIVTDIGVLLGYPVAMETLWRGRTLGKAAMGLRVVRDDGGPIRFRHALVRGLVGLFIEKPGITSGFGALAFISVSNRKKRIGDYFAGTVVLQERVPGNLDAPIAMPPALAGWAASLDLATVDDGLALQLRHFLARATSLTPAARATLEHQMTSEIIARVGAAPAGAPNWAIITAVLAERRRRAFAAMPQPPQPAWGQPQPAWGQPQWPAQPPWPQHPQPAVVPSPTAGWAMPGSEGAAPTTQPQSPATTGTVAPSAVPVPAETPASTTGFAPPA